MSIKENKKRKASDANRDADIPSKVKCLNKKGTVGLTNGIIHENNNQENAEEILKNENEAHFENESDNNLKADVGMDTNNGNHSQSETEEQDEKEVMLTIDIKSFRNELSSESALTALRRFISAPRTVVSEYLQSGGNAFEILSTISKTDKKNIKEAVVVFEALHRVLFEIVANFGHLIPNAIEACRYLMNTHMNIIHSMLGSTSAAKQRKIVLKLLTSIVSLNSLLGRDILSHLSLHIQIVEMLSTHVNPMDKNSVRICFIHFLMSFLIDGDLPLIRQLLSRKGILNCIIPGLIYDYPTTVNLVLTTIKTHILENINISKTLKMHTFNNFTVQHLVKLYDWLGPCNFLKPNTFNKSKFKKTTREVHPDDKEIVLKSVHDFMIVLCTSYKYGIAFQSKTGNIINKSNNPLLSIILKSIDKPWENDKKKDLVIASLGTCLDLYQSYISQISPYLAPRNSKMWIKSMSFMHNLITQISPDKLMKNNEYMNIKQFSTNVTSVYMPETILKYFNNEFFETNKDVAVEYQSLKLLQTMLKQVNVSMNYIQELKAESKNNIDVNSFQKHISECISKLLPSAEIILGCWLIASNIKNENEIEEAGADICLPTIDERKELILDLLLTYDTYNSVTYQNLSMNLNSEDILDKIDNFSKNDENKIDSVCLKTLELLLQVNIKEFIPNTPLFERTFSILLEQYVLNDCEDSKQIKDLITKLIKSTGLYDANKFEIEVWLYSFKYVDNIYKKNVINFFYYVICNSYKETLKYYERMGELKKQALVDDDNPLVLQKSAYDDIFDNIENLNDNSYTNLEINNLGPVLICALELFQEKKFKENLGIETYLSFVSLYLFHSQYSYKVVSYLVESNLEIFQEYFQPWMVMHDIIPLKKICGVKTLMCKVSKIILNEKPIDVYKVLGLQKCEEQTEYSFNVLGQIVVYQEQLNNIDIFCLLNMCIFYISRLAQVSKLTEGILDNIQKIYFGLHDIASKQSETETNNIFLQAMKLLLTNPIILQYFNPITKKKKNCDMLITKFVKCFVNFLQDSKRGNGLYEKYLLPYRSKTIRSLKKAIDKQSILKNDDVINILELFNITFDECLIILSMLCELDYTNYVSVENDVSSWYKILLFVLNNICNLSMNEDKIDRIPVNTGSNLAKLYINLKTEIEVEINVDSLEDILYQLITAFPQIIPEFSRKLKSMLNSKRISKSTAKFISLCLERDWDQSTYFLKYIKKIENISKREIIFPLLTAALKNNFEDTSILQKVYDEHKMSILKVIEKPHKAGQVYKDNYKMLSHMIYKCMDLATCSSFTNKILKFEVSEIFHMDVLHKIFMKVVQSKPKERKHLENYYIVFIMFLNVILRREQIDVEKVSYILDNIINWTTQIKKEESFNGSNVLKHSSWEIFCKLALKNGLKLEKHLDSAKHSNSILLKVLAYLCKNLYQEKNDDACVIFQMAISHSEFLNVMLKMEENDAKTNLLELMWYIVQKNPSVMQSSHIPLYLGAYQASLMTSDRIILALLQLYEKSGISLYEYRPFLWGEAAVNHYSVRGSVGNNLWRQPSMNEVLDLLDPHMVDNTIRNFPFWRSMDAIQQVYFHEIEEVNEKLSNFENRSLEKYIDRVNLVENEDGPNNEALRKLLQDENTIVTCSSDLNKPNEVYDPAFYLPLFALLFAPEAAPATGKAAVSGVTTMIWRAMGSSHSDTRATACLAITRLRGHIDAQRNAKDKSLWLQLIDFVRKSISEDLDDEVESLSVPSLTSITSLFLSRTSKVLTQPLNQLYEPLTNYLLVKEKIELKTVPEMLLLLHNSNPDYKIHRIWMLELIRDGLKTMEDFEVLINSCAYKLIMDFYSCTLCDKDCKILILNIVNNTIKIPKAASILCEGHGLLPWLSGLILILNQTDNDLLTAVIILINNLRCSLTALKISENLTLRDVKIIDKSDFVLSDHTSNFLRNLVIMISSKLTHRLNAKTIIKYLKTSNYLAKHKKIFDETAIENLINVCEKIFKVDSDCKILIKTNAEHAEPMKDLFQSILNSEADQIVQYGIKYLMLLVRNWLNIQNS